MKVGLELFSFIGPISSSIEPKTQNMAGRKVLDPSISYKHPILVFIELKLSS